MPRKRLTDVTLVAATSVVVEETVSALSASMRQLEFAEVLLLSDRVAVMHEGRVAGILERQECTEPRIMTLAVASGA